MTASAFEPAPAFAASCNTVRAFIQLDSNDQSLNTSCIPRLYDHGATTEDAVVLFHGLTSCPKQFDILARRFHSRGANVYVPRIPYHGKKDRMTRDLTNLTAPILQAAATQAYQLSRGLGTRVTVLGLSLGGTMALYLAQTQPVDRAVAVSPFLAPIRILRGPGDCVMRLLAWLPDLYFWWDPRIRERNPPHYAYPGYSTHALAACVAFGSSIFDAARCASPRGKQCTLVVNQRESAVNNAVTRQLFSIWRKRGAAYDEVVFKGLGWRHDIIDSTTFLEAETLVYPKLEAIVFP